jgi:hypothetical protein
MFHLVRIFTQHLLVDFVKLRSFMDYGQEIKYVFVCISILLWIYFSVCLVFTSQHINNYLNTY